MLKVDEALPPTAALAAYPTWYTLALSGGLKRAIANHFVERRRTQEQLPWMVGGVESVDPPIQQLNDDAAANGLGHASIMPPPSSLRVAAITSRGALPDEQLSTLGGLVGDGTFASERLTTAEALYRGVEPPSRYGAMNTSRHKQQRSASAGGRFLHLDDKGISTHKSKRSPMLVSPSFTADPQEVIAEASSLIHRGSSSFAVGGGSASSPSPARSTANPSHPPPSSLTHIPVPKTQYTSGHRDLLLQKANALIHCLNSGQLFVSPVKGTSLAAATLTNARQYSQQRATDPSFGMSPYQQQKAKEELTALQRTADAERELKERDGCIAFGGSPTAGGGGGHHQRGVWQTRPTSAGSTLHGVRGVSAGGGGGTTGPGDGSPSRHQKVPPPPAAEVLDLLATTAATVVANLGPTTAELLTTPLRDDFSATVKRNNYAIVSEGERLAAADAANDTTKKEGGAAAATAAIIPTTAIAKEVKSYTFTNAKANDALVQYARREAFGIDDAANRLKDGELEHSRKREARIVARRALGIEGQGVGDLKRSDGSPAEEPFEALPLLEGSCTMVALRSALAFGLDGVDVSMRDEVSCLLRPSSPPASGNGSAVPSHTTTKPSPALAAVLQWLWGALKQADEALNDNYMPQCLKTLVKAGQSDHDKLEAETQRNTTVSSVLVEAFAILAYDVVCGGAYSSGSDGFSHIRAADPSAAAIMAIANRMTAFATSSVGDAVQYYAEETHGYADKRHVMANSTRMLLALRAALGPMLEVGRRGDDNSNTQPSSPSRVRSKYPTTSSASSPTAKAPILESGTELINDDDDYDGLGGGGGGSPTKKGMKKAPPQPPKYTDDELALLLLVFLSRITVADIVATSAVMMRPLWEWMARPTSSGGSHHHHQQGCGDGNGSTYSPIRIGSGGGGGPRPPSAVIKRPETASSLKRLMENPHPTSAAVVDEILTLKQREEEAAGPISSVGITRRDPVTRVSRDEYNLERVVMSRLSRKLVNSAIEDMGKEDAVLMTMGGGGVGDRSTSPTTVAGGRPQTPTNRLQPSSLTKLLNDVHLKPVLATETSPIDTKYLTSTPNRVGLGGSVKNNAMPPFSTAVDASTYRTMRAYVTPQPGSSTAGDASTTVPSATATATTPQERLESHFVQYLANGVISEPYRRQLAHAHPYVMTTLQRAAEVAAEQKQLQNSLCGGATRSPAHGDVAGDATVEAVMVGSSPHNTRGGSRSGTPTRMQHGHHHHQGGYIDDAAALRTVLASPAFHVHTPPKPYMHPTRTQSATRQRQFQQIQAYLDAKDEEAHKKANGGGGRPPSAAGGSAAKVPDGSIIIAHNDGGSPTTGGGNMRPRSGKFFSRTPSGYGSTLRPSSGGNTSGFLYHGNTEPAVGVVDNNHHEQHTSSPTITATAAAVVMMKDIDGTMREVPVGSCLGEAPSEIQRVGTPTLVGGNSSPQKSGTLARRPLSGGVITSKCGVAVQSAVVASTPQKGSSTPSGALVTTTTTNSTSPIGRIGSVDISTVGRSPLYASHRPTSAPSIPSPARRRYGLPVRDVDRVIAAREFVSAAEGGATINTTTASPSKHVNNSHVSNNSTSRTQRAPPYGHPAVFKGKVSTSASSISHTPVGTDGPSANGANSGALLLVPQLAALPVTSGGSFSQKLSAGFFNPTNRQKKF